MSNRRVKLVRDLLIRAKSQLDSIEMDEELTVRELVIPDKKKIISDNIENIVQETQGLFSTPAEMLVFINSIHYDQPDFPETNLKSFNNFQSVRKYTNSEKNVLKVTIPTPTGILLPEDTLILSISIYHPVHKHKTQEWLITSDITLEALHNNIQCLANYCTFGTASELVFFKFGEKTFKNLSTMFDEIDLVIGELYTYSHKGICQHDLIVTDIRLINKADPQSAEFYPFQKFACRSKRRLCEVCERFHAKFISVKSQNLEVAYIYLCEKCLEGIQPGSSEIYPYLYD